MANRLGVWHINVRHDDTCPTYWRKDWRHDRPMVLGHRTREFLVIQRAADTAHNRKETHR